MRTGNRGGVKLFVCDNSMVELRVIAWLANESNMREFFRQGVDLHKATAAYISLALPKHGLTMKEFWPRRNEFIPLIGDKSEERRRAKPVNFGKSFGQQDEGFIAFSRTSWRIRFTRAEARMVHEGFFELYPALPGWFEECRKEFERGWMVTPMGQYRRHFQDLPEAINFRVQGTASQLLLLALLQAEQQIKEARLNAWLFNEVHDSILGAGSDAHAEKAGHIVKRCMERPPTEWLGLPFDSIPVPLKADLTISERWVKE